MDSIFETQRQTHEEIERYEQALSDILAQNPTAQRNITRRDRKAADVLKRIDTLRSELVQQYEDIPALRSSELEALQAGAPPEDPLEEFYNRLDKVKDFHRKNPGVSGRQFILELDELVKGDGLQTIRGDGEEEPVVLDPLDSVFSGEEAYGKHLDLYQSHTQYLNLEGAVRLSYIAYLDMLRRETVERNLELRDKSTREYLEYVQTLYNYLVSFFERALPLMDLDAKLKEEGDNFAAAWEAGQVEGWTEGPAWKKAAVKPAGEGIWCPYCQKHYSKQTVYDAHLKSDKHKKKAANDQPVPDPSTTNGSAPSSSNPKSKYLPPARLTYLVQKLLAFPPIPQLLADSRTEVERRMALTSREREAELEEADEAPPPITITEEEEEEEDDGKIYNPLKLPLGWDGKPIPYWLYKLHGLGVEFKCEICSDFVYMGRKGFERHFQESRHAFGMRALGLPNTRHFHSITKIQDALALASKLRQEGRDELKTMSMAEEMEDSEGNVYAAGVYRDLVKQGVIN